MPRMRSLLSWSRRSRSDNGGGLRPALVLIMAAVLLSSCQRGVRYASMLPAMEAGEPLYPQGVFYYETSAMGQQLKGRIIIVDTLVIVEPVDDRCRLPEFMRDPPKRQVERRVFTCVGVAVTSTHAPQGTTQLEINLRRPMHDSRWARYTTHTQQKCYDCALTAPRWVWGRLNVSRTPFAADTGRPPG
ncbi:MAG TPA: hypothetical protein VF178_13550 [Gemmatimonadaceae bacterium]